MARIEVFASNMKDLGNKVRTGASKMQRTVALAIDQTLVLATPVGDPTLWKNPAPKGYTGGHARGNWQVSIDTAIESEVPDIDPTGASALSQGQAALASFQGGDIHITNNVPYIIPLNEGHSTQAPAGFVELAIADGQAAARAARILEG